MELQEVEVFIAPDGTTRIEVRGVSGAGCLDLTEDLEKALGGRVIERELTAEAQEVLQQRTEERVRREPNP
ncbi:DUF2997 domain-containing protein [Actinomadura darangshiensis]|uniref:DUF2997 domain-containing protein n=1 Tax=Actinomadura darangshiensis TaxID=705336 RepID=A0A4R5BME1_9ACTN|nr:DUF2997 domain-containing protein [Actinomadura darangshiensis]TDD87951.1 DUF2997 domain-containing protein [Actinomadura darangshiensis]